MNPLLNESPSRVPTGTWRRLGIRRAIGGSATALALFGAAAGTAFALTSRAGAESAPASSPSTVVSATTPAAKSPARSAPAPDAHAPTVAAPSARAAAPSAPVYQGIQDEELRPKGLHPYRLGDRFTNLQSQGLLKVVGESPACDWIGARGLARYHEPFMSFIRGTMVSLMVDSPDVPTFNGAHVVMSLADVRGRHPAGRELTHGDRYAWLVTDGTHALMFRFDHSGIVESIVAGHARGLEFQFTDGGEGC